jgi:beta-glucosidase
MGYTDTKVGCANHVRVFAPKDSRNLWHKVAASMSSFLFQDALTDAMTLGRFPFPLRNFAKLPKGEYTDFIGLNYYSRSTVSGIGDGVRENSPRNDLDWEIYPSGLVECAKALYDVLPRPIWVTENGTCDNTDAFRSRFIYDQLELISRVENPITRYYHWSFMDNFEWREGESARFGLVHVDYKTQTRTVKDSGRLYSAIIRDGGVTEDVYNKYVEGSEYRR